MLFYRLV